MSVHRNSIRRIAVLPLAAALAFAAASAGFAGPARAVALGDLPTGLSTLLARFDATASTRGIAEFGATPTAAQVAGLASLGLRVQPMRHLPLALVFGTVSQMEAAVTSGIAEDVYPDRSIQLFDTASSDAMGGAAARAGGFTGKGVTVAVVDSGCDASHPDLADHVIHNVKVVSGEYLNQVPDSSNTIVVANEVGPYQNTDLGSGHGTHVAGIIAADSTTDPSGGRLGVAPDPSLVCIAVGEVLFTTAVVTAYDFMLDQPDLWGIRVVNNSWGNAYRMFDPRDPVNVATKAMADLGVTVVFAAGNSGYSETEMSLNPFSEAPWVVSVAAGTLDHGRAEFSSNGLIFDNSQAVTIPGGGHMIFTGDRIGVYHPDLTAPGDNISSTCDSAGTVVGPCPPGSNTTASGTSMASPHVAGAAAVLLQANPNLTPDQVRMALQSTATPVTRFGATTNAPFWQVGYGYVDLGAAIQLVRGKGWAKDLSRAQARADARVLAEDGFRIARSDFWTYDAPRLTLAGVGDTRTVSTTVPLGVTHLKVALSHPSLASAQLNGTHYTVTVRDAAGNVLGTTTEAPLLGAGTSSVLIDLRVASPAVVYGTFSFEIVGDYAASDPDTLDSDSALGRMVTLSVVQLTQG